MLEPWLLLLHQIPPKPAYFRAKVLRRLVRIGALPVKNSAYVLPDREDTLEDFEWIAQEIRNQGGAAWLFRAEVLAGMSSGQMEEAFRQLRVPDYEELVHVAQEFIEMTPPLSSDALMTQQKLSQMYERVKSIDFFDCPLRHKLEELMAEMEKRIRPLTESPAGLAARGGVWVTRKGVRVDRIGSAWLIKRFIDPEAAFRFVAPDHYRHAVGEIRFDMFEGEVTHEGDLCTFEVLVSRSNLLHNHPALGPIAEIVHDIDLKDDRYQRLETPGLARMIDGLCARNSDDELRLERGAMIFDNLYDSFAG